MYMRLQGLRGSSCPNPNAQLGSSCLFPEYRELLTFSWNKPFSVKNPIQGLADGVDMESVLLPSSNQAQKGFLPALWPEIDDLLKLMTLPFLPSMRASSLP